MELLIHGEVQPPKPSREQHGMDATRRQREQREIRWAHVARPTYVKQGLVVETRAHICGGIVAIRRTERRETGQVRIRELVAVSGQRLHLGTKWEGHWM